ncbi:hypothetical protein [Corallococcus sicarius]|uniref:hypothetical protein n=1 Tax=Corallococcus sicarius TaxID=2316726 RepID=UPI0011C39F41|nr:hypothetical protein [Corallococcus sicarius]
MENDLLSAPTESFVTVWTKGFRVSEDSDEFQRVVPPKDDFLLSLESELQKSKVWPSVLEPLYGLAEHELSTQRCMLVRSDEIGVFAVSRSEDKHSRPNLVVVLVAARIDWRDQDLGNLVARLSNLAGRLSKHFSATFRRNPTEVQAQLRAANFLSDRKYNISEEPPSAIIDWGAIINTVRKWRGIQGVSTLKLATLGANIVLGTRGEAERLASRIDGYIDMRTLQIVPLNPSLTPWAKPDEIPVGGHTSSLQETPPSLPVTSKSEDQLASIEQSLKEISGSVSRIADVFLGISEGLLKIFSGGTRRDR